MARDVLPHAMGNGHPAFFGWVNSPPALAGVLASLVAAAMNPSVVSGDHADVHLERTVVRWLASWSGTRTRQAAGCSPAGPRPRPSSAWPAPAAAPLPRPAATYGGRARGRAALVATAGRGAQLRAAAIELLGLGSGWIRPVPLTGRPSRPGRAARRDRGRPRCRRDARAAGGLGGHGEHGRDRSARRAADVAAAEGLWFTSTGPTAPSACSTRRSPRATGGWSARTRWRSTRKVARRPGRRGCALVRRADYLRARSA